MRPQHGRADPICIVVAWMPGPVERQKLVLPGAPTRDIFLYSRVGAFIDADANAERGFRGGPAKTQGEDEAAAACGHVYFAGKSDIAVTRDIVAPAQLEMFPKVLPSVRRPNKADRARHEGNRAPQGEDRSPAFGKKHRHALVVVDPGRIARSHVHEV